jgi:hypothetical protein
MLQGELCICLLRSFLYFIKHRGFLDQLRDCWLVMIDPAAWYCVYTCRAGKEITGLVRNHKFHYSFLNDNIARVRSFGMPGGAVNLHASLACCTLH